MSGQNEGPATGSIGFFASWLLLHEKADDWIRDAIARAEATPEELRKEYQRFLIGINREKEMLKGVFGEAIENELKHMGFMHRDDVSPIKDEVDELRRRIHGLEEKLERG